MNKWKNPNPITSHFQKAKGMGGGSGSTVRTQVIDAHLVIGLYGDGEIRILKNRFTGLKGVASLDGVVEMSSILISKRVFENNNLKIFQEGLCKEIQIAIKDTIEKFHTKEVV